MNNLLFSFVMSCNNFTLLSDKKGIRQLCDTITVKHLIYLLGYKSNNAKIVFFSEKHEMNSFFKRCLSMVEFSTYSVCKMIN